MDFFRGFFGLFYSGFTIKKIHAKFTQKFTHKFTHKFMQKFTHPREISKGNSRTRVNFPKEVHAPAWVLQRRFRTPVNLESLGNNTMWTHFTICDAYACFPTALDTTLPQHCCKWGPGQGVRMACNQNKDNTIHAKFTLLAVSSDIWAHKYF